MRATLKRLLKMTVGYGAVQWAGPFISFVFTPILTRILTPSDYGITDYVLTVASGISTLALFALPEALMTHFNDRPGDEEWQQRITGSALALASLIGAPFSVGLIAFAPQLAEFSLQDQRYTIFFQLVGAGLLFGVVNAILTTAARAGLRVRWGMLFSLTTILMTVLGNVLFIIILRWGVLGMVLAPVTTGVVLSAVVLVIMRARIGAPQLSVMKQLFRSGAWLLPAMASAWILQMVDRLFLVHYVTTQELGYYAIANRVAGLLFVLMAPVYSAWMPLALSMLHDPGAQQRYADMARYLIGIVLFAAMGLGLFATEILIVWTHTPYLPAAPYVGFLAYVHVISAVGTVLSTGAMAGKHLAAISWTVFVGAMVNIVLNFTLIPAYGLWGATVATVIGYAVQPILLYPLAQKRFPIPYSTTRLLAVLAVQVGLMLIGVSLPPMIFPLRVALKLGLAALLPIAFITFGVITRFELRQTQLFARHQLRLAFARVQSRLAP